MGPYDFPRADEPIESCSDTSSNVSLMSCITFSKRSQPLRARSHNFILPLKENRNFILRALYTAVCPVPLPRRGKLIVKTAGKTSRKQYFINKLVHNRHSLSSFHRKLYVSC